MKKILELLDKVNEMSFDEIEIDAEGITVKVKRQPKVAPSQSRHSPNPLDEFGGFSIAKEAKEPGLASHGQVKYARDLLMRSFANDEIAYMDFLAHTLELPMQDIDHPDTWDETMTREMAAVILNPLEKMNGINKNR